MFVGVGVGAYASGIFHLVTHAFFKGLMFLTAGSVMHAMANELDMRKMGGLRAKMPITHWTFLVGAMAIAGVPFLSGFWSKDEILHSAWAISPVIYGIGLITAFLTAFYMFRLIFVTFYGESRVESGVASHLHESPPVMWVPLAILAIPSALIGLLLGWGGHNSWFHHFTEHVFPKAHGEASGNMLVFMGISSVVGLAGIAFAWIRYRERVPSAELPMRCTNLLRTSTTLTKCITRLSCSRLKTVLITCCGASWIRGLLMGLSTGWPRLSGLSEARCGGFKRGLSKPILCQWLSGLCCFWRTIYLFDSFRQFGSAPIFPGGISPCKAGVKYQCQNRVSFWFYGVSC